MTDPRSYLRAAMCPPSLVPQQFGLWTIQRRPAPPLLLPAGDQQTALCRITEATMHQEPGEVVMEDSILELSRHLPIWLRARGRVLVTGLGLGCVVRGLLAAPDVSHIDVIELDQGIIDAVGPEFASDIRVNVVRGNALTCKMPAARWDFAWHDIWCEGSGLQLLHVKLMNRFSKRCAAQGAWMLPRFVKRRFRRTWGIFG